MEGRLQMSSHKQTSSKDRLIEQLDKSGIMKPSANLKEISWFADNPELKCSNEKLIKLIDLGREIEDGNVTISHYDFSCLLIMACKHVVSGEHIKQNLTRGMSKPYESEIL